MTGTGDRPPDVTVAAGAAGAALASGSALAVTVVTRSYFSVNYLWSARHHTRLAAELERDGGQVPSSLRHRAYVIDAVTDAVAFMEAAVNEV